MKRCTKCCLPKTLDEYNKHKLSKDGRAYWCKDCVNSYNKRYRTSPKGRESIRAGLRKYNKSKKRLDSNRRYKGRNPEKYRARWRLNSAIKVGTIVAPAKCGRCSMPGKVQAHHEDYSKPLDVIWVCRNCHDELHLAAVPAGHEK